MQSYTSFPCLLRYISQWLKYVKTSSDFCDSFRRHWCLRDKLLDQGYKKIGLIGCLKRFISDIHTLLKNILFLITR